MAMVSMISAKGVACKIGSSFFNIHNTQLNESIPQIWIHREPFSLTQVFLKKNLVMCITEGGHTTVRYSKLIHSKESLGHYLQPTT